ncbi:MAG: hypothetical protein JW395_3451 [Nitrospira sp.]|nr:hypothetical protein [Nitrospira sp.]
MSKRIPAKSRSPAVTFAAGPSGLLIRITMPNEDAKAIADKATSKARAKATASKIVLSALGSLRDENTRDRSGFLQADIPTQLKVELAEVAKAKGTNITSLIVDRLSEWINPSTGRRRLKKGQDGSASPAGPPNYRKFVSRTGAMYSEAVKSRSLVRLQIEVGSKVVRCIQELLYSSRVPKGRFLTALAADVINRHQAPTSGVSR